MFSSIDYLSSNHFRTSVHFVAYKDSAVVINSVEEDLEKQSNAKCHEKRFIKVNHQLSRRILQTKIVLHNL